MTPLDIALTACIVLAAITETVYRRHLRNRRRNGKDGP